MLLDKYSAKEAKTVDAYLNQWKASGKYQAPEFRKRKS